ncbi:hypothetical protein B9J85_04885 [Vibrio sp. V11_P1A41T118]|nr:hypothetical protein B9J85_04885 [Vibrio sp. V11_P1A41T118]
MDDFFALVIDANAAKNSAIHRVANRFIFLSLSLLLSVNKMWKRFHGEVCIFIVITDLFFFRVIIFS